MLRQHIISLLFLALLSPAGYNASAQCPPATVKFPAENQPAPYYNNVISTVSTVQNAGQYFVIEHVEAGKTYQFGSSMPGDIFTIRNVYDPTIVYASGTTPLSFTAGVNDIVAVHLHASGCVTNTTNRSVIMQCMTCSAEPAKVGINEPNPKATLDVNGEILLGNSGRPPVAGMVRWNNASQDFEGFNGKSWLSLTRSQSGSGWGQVKPMQTQENKKLIASDGAAIDFFGYSVATNGDYAVIGAYQADIGVNTDQGAAYVFKRDGNTWTQMVKLTASDGLAGDNFGNSVAIADDYIVVGAFSADKPGVIDAGCAYIFKRTGAVWAQESKIFASDGLAGDYFGYSVSINAGYIAVGAVNDDIGTNQQQGSVYFFRRTGSFWIQEAKFVAADGAAGDNLGYSVSISGNYAVAGAPFADEAPLTNKGAAYIFFRNGTSWTQQAKVSGSDAGTGSLFGLSVAISGDYAVCGSPFTTIQANTGQGAAYVYKRNGVSWPAFIKLVGTDGAAGDNFGQSVSMNIDNIAVGASAKDEDGNPGVGAAYIFKKTIAGFEQEAKLSPSDGGNNDKFGYKISIFGTVTLVASYHDKVGNNDLQGSAYIFMK